jgi:hypothetical protein
MDTLARSDLALGLFALVALATFLALMALLLCERVE